MMPTIPALTLNDGADLPLLGLGTYELRGERGINAVVAAIDSGYRLLDSAVDYENEREVDEAVRRSSVDPAELTVVTKIPGVHHGYDKAIESTNGSLAALGTDRIDLSLIHWPNPRMDKFVDTWRAMIDLRESGAIRSIGVSNFTAAMLTRVPAVNQVELPLLPAEGSACLPRP
jgi:2,5-diketo-D-gluconate reductase A